jgi:hypothetical protein
MKHVNKVQLLISTVLLSGLLHAGTVLADCATPKGPDVIPDGKTAAKEEMLAAMTAFKQYNTDVDAFAECLKAETTEKVKDGSIAAGQVMQFKSMQNRKDTTAKEELKTKVDKFNEQVRLYKARN